MGIIHCASELPYECSSTISVGERSLITCSPSTERLIACIMNDSCVCEDVGWMKDGNMCNNTNGSYDHC
jgi:hypothetical protein